MHMDYRIFINNLIEQENLKLENAEKKYWEYYITAVELSTMLYKCIYSADISWFIFLSYLSQIQKYLLLSIFSTVRLHHDESQMNLRKAIESIILACYSMVFTDEKIYVDKDWENLSKPSKKHYEWLENKYKIESNYLKSIKDIINSWAAHSSIVHAMFNVEHRETENLFETNFFDKKIDILIKTDLNTISRVILITISLINKLNDEYNIVVFDPFFKEKFHELAEKADKQKKELRKYHNL